MAVRKEFQEFVVRGNVLDLAVAFILGVAFGDVVKSLVNDVLMPPLGLVLGGANFRDLYVPLNGQSYASLDAARAAGAPVIAYGAFLNTVVSFLLVAFAVFLLVRQINRLRRDDKPPVATKTCDQCLSPVPLGARRCAQCTSPLASAA